MPMCKARNCSVRRGEGVSAFSIPDPERHYELCKKWLYNLVQKNSKHAKFLDIKTFKFSKQNIVCEKHFEPNCFKENLKVS